MCLFNVSSFLDLYAHNIKWLCSYSGKALKIIISHGHILKSSILKLFQSTSWLPRIQKLRGTSSSYIGFLYPALISFIISLTHLRKNGPNQIFCVLFASESMDSQCVILASARRSLLSLPSSLLGSKTLLNYGPTLNFSQLQTAQLHTTFGDNCWVFLCCLIQVAPTTPSWPVGPPSNPCSCT